MPIGISSRNIEVIQDFALFHKIVGDLYWNFPQQAGDYVTVGFLPEDEMKRFYGFLGRLLRSKAGPLVAILFLGGPRLFQISFRLRVPIFRAINH